MKYKNIFSMIILVSLIACSSNKSLKQPKNPLPSTTKPQSKLSKDYPHLFSAMDAYVHLPPEELEQDSVVSRCYGGKTDEVIAELFSEMKDQTVVHIKNYYVALCYYSNKDSTRALHYFGKVLAQTKDISIKAKAQMNMAIIQWQWGKLKKALSYARESVALKVTPATLYLLASMEISLGLSDKVVTRLSEMSKYNYNDDQWRFVRADGSFFVSDYDQATELYAGLSKNFWQSNKKPMTHYVLALYKSGRTQVLRSFVQQWKRDLLADASYKNIKITYPEIAKYE